MAEKKKEEKDSEVFVLKLNPETILFSSSSLGDETTSATLKLTNPTKEKIAFKIKCTSNEMFKIKVPVGLLKPDEITEIALFHTPGKPIPENLKQYFAVYYVKTDSDVSITFKPLFSHTSLLQKPVRELWKNAKKHDGVKRVFITFEKLPKKDKKEEKKGDKEDKKEKDDKKDDKKEKADKKDDCEKQNTEEKKDTTEEKKEEKKEDEKEKKEEKKDDEEKK
ncbi:hypothetical protein CRE_28435 [Caenorhabditis remanei]|uniref:Major sperm protein n=1 Tax=Caenorhabditis remanei TaxID=31234 RepID=E3LME8_CAERE|nr:hypothetical protein CRE_28435 [Caenorhabditis remanei]